VPDDTVRESVIEKYLISRLRTLRVDYGFGVIVKKVGGPGWRGWPDRMVLFQAPDEVTVHGCTHWVELKRPKGGRFEPLQLRRHDRLRDMHFVVRVANTKALVDKYVDDILHFGPHRMPY